MNSESNDRLSVESPPAHCLPHRLRPLLNLISKNVNHQYIDPQLRLHMSCWEQGLSERPYFTGDEFTAADIQMSFPLEAALSRAKNPGGFAKNNALVAAFRERPAYQRALERGGEYSL